MTKKLTTAEFKEKAKTKHGTRYDYSKAKYVNTGTKVIIICKEHGEFTQTPNSHISGNGCATCYGNSKLTTDGFIQTAIVKHEGRYDYSKVVYKGSRVPVVITCMEHGDFTQIPASHLHGSGCSVCGGIDSSTARRKHVKEFIQNAMDVHGDRYGYGNVDYKGSKTKVLITCKVHCDFTQIPNDHLKGHGCQKCAVVANADTRRKTDEEFIQAANVVHLDKYEYGNVDYIDSRTNIWITCKEHGDYAQKPNDHRQGSGCPKCAKKNDKFENDIRDFVKTLLPDSQVLDAEKGLLENEQRLELDMYIAKYNLAIEPGSLTFHLSKESIHRDHRKMKACEEQGIKVITVYYEYWKSATGKEKIKKALAEIINGRISGHADYSSNYAMIIADKTLNKKVKQSLKNPIAMTGHKTQQSALAMYTSKIKEQVDMYLMD